MTSFHDVRRERLPLFAASMGPNVAEVKMLHLLMEAPSYRANFIVNPKELGELQDQVHPNVALRTFKPSTVLYGNPLDPNLLKGLLICRPQSIVLIGLWCK